MAALRLVEDDGLGDRATPLCGTQLLDLLSEVSIPAAQAPRGTGLYRFLADGLALEDSDTTPNAPFTWLTEELIVRLGVWWSPSGYARLPTMTPWCIRDRSARYDQGPESWGAPRDDGYFRDDNSIIKKLPLPLSIITAPGHRYAGRVLNRGRGFTACHIWRLLDDGGIAGTDPWLYYHRRRRQRRLGRMTPIEFETVYADQPLALAA